MKASRALREASEIIGDSPAALQLRYLQVRRLGTMKNKKRVEKLIQSSCSASSRPQTLNTISAEKNSTIIFPLPIDIMTFFMKKSE
jgi:erythrocyte band 7 integral membrane protein